MEFPILNKFEKKERVIALHTQGKTLRQIASEVKMSFRDISKIIKVYDKKMRLENKKGEKKNLTIKPSIGSQSFMLYQKGKKIDEVKVLLDIPFKKAETFWEQYLKSISMEDCYEFYQEFQYYIPTLLSISNFMKKNNIHGKNIAKVLRTANDVITLNKTYSNLKAEIERLKQMKNNYLSNFISLFINIRK